MPGGWAMGGCCCVRARRHGVSAGRGTLLFVSGAGASSTAVCWGRPPRHRQQPGPDRSGGWAVSGRTELCWRCPGASGGLARLAAGSSVAISWMLRKMHERWAALEPDRGARAYAAAGTFYFLRTGRALGWAGARSAFRRMHVLKNPRLLFCVVSSYN